MAQTLRTRYAPPVPVIRPPQGTTYAREAAGNTSTFPSIAQSFQGFSQPQSGVIAGKPEDAAAALNAVNNAPANLAPLGTAYGSSRIVPTPLQTGALTSAPGSFASNTFVDPATGKTALATASIPSNSASQPSGIFVNGQSSTHDENGNLVAATGPADNPAARQAAALQALKAQHPDIFKAGTDANTQFVAATKKAGLNNGSDPTDLLATANTLFGSKVAGAGEVAAGAKAIKPASGLFDQSAMTKAGNQVAQALPTPQVGPSIFSPDYKAPPNAGQRAANAITGTAKDVGSAVSGAYDTAAQNTSGFLGGLFGQSSSDINKLGAQYGQDTSALGIDALTSPTPSLRPTGQPVAPPTNTLANALPSVPPVAAAPTIPGPTPLAPTALTTPVDPDELKRRQALANNS